MNTLILSCLISVTDRYGLMREFTLNQFERTVNHCNDIQALRDLCVTLHSTVHSQRSVYESMLRDFGKLPPEQ